MHVADVYVVFRDFAAVNSWLSPAPGYLRTCDEKFGLVLSFMTLAEMRQGALDANWGQRKCDLLEAYLAFSVLHSDGLLCSTGAGDKQS